jgi:hypothetical protein
MEDSVTEILMNSIKKINDEHEGTTHDEYSESNKVETIKDIGFYISKRMRNSLEHTDHGKQLKLGINNSLLLAFPGEGQDSFNLYSEINKQRGDLYSGDNEPLKFMHGDPLSNTIDYDGSPTLAMGDAKILNPDFQFNELDDVRSDFRRPYIGRLYSERIYDYNLPTVIFETGILTLNLGLFSTLKVLTGSRSDTADMTSYLRDPKGTMSIKFMFKKMGAAIRGILNFTTGGILSGKRFYKFTPNMRVYMRFVNEMLIEIAAWMKLAQIPSTDKSALDAWNNKDRIGADSEKDAEEIERLIDSESQKSTMTGNTEMGIPASPYRGASKTLSVLNILPGWRTKNVIHRNDENGNLGQSLQDGNTEIVNLTAAQFIPYGLSKGVQVSESFSNRTMEHPLAAELKAKGQQVYSQSAMGLFNDMNTATKTIQALFQGDYLKALGGVSVEAIKGAAKNGIFGEAGMMVSGEGKFQLPNVWEDSEYSRMYTLNFKFRSPYGNRLCIFENTMVPTIFFICMTAPRQVGVSTYTSPFYVRAFSKGLFSTEIGLIDKLDINRSEEKNERTVEGFSKVINCSVSIKDVVPNLMVGLDAGVFGILSAKNTGFREYIAMMANLDLYDRTAIINKYNTFITALTNEFNPENIMNELKYSISQTLPYKLILKARTNFMGYKPPVAVSSIRSQSQYGM